MSGSFARLATVTASTKRMGAVSGGLSGDMETNIASLSCTPLDPGYGVRANLPEIVATSGGGGFVELLQTMVEGGLDILEGDHFIVGSTTYKVRAVAEWNWPPDNEDTLQLVLEEVK